AGAASGGARTRPRAPTSRGAQAVAAPPDRPALALRVGARPAGCAPQGGTSTGARPTGAEPPRPPPRGHPWLHGDAESAPTGVVRAAGPAPGGEAAAGLGTRFGA